MNINASHRKTIDKIIMSMQCPKDFECAKSDFTELRKVRDLGLTGLVECMADRGDECVFAIPFGFGHFCKCPLRVYLAKEPKI
jgi:hypothetical protein